MDKIIEQSIIAFDGLQTGEFTLEEVDSLIEQGYVSEDVLDVLVETELVTLEEGNFTDKIKEKLNSYRTKKYFDKYLKDTTNRTNLDKAMSASNTAIEHGNNIMKRYNDLAKYHASKGDNLYRRWRQRANEKKLEKQKLAMKKIPQFSVIK